MASRWKRSSSKGWSNGSLRRAPRWRRPRPSCAVGGAGGARAGCSARRTRTSGPRGRTARTDRRSGVIAAATMTMIRTTWRRQPASCCGVTTPTTWSATMSTGNWKPTPKARIMNIDSLTKLRDSRADLDVGRGDLHQELHRLGEREVGDGPTEREQQHGRHRVRQGVPPFPSVEPRSDEPPDLPQDHRHREDQPPVPGDPQPQGERIEEVGLEEAAVGVGARVLEGGAVRGVEDVDEPRVEEPRRDHHDQDGADADGQAVAQLLQVVAEGHVAGIPLRPLQQGIPQLDHSVRLRGPRGNRARQGRRPGTASASGDARSTDAAGSVLASASPARVTVANAFSRASASWRTDGVLTGRIIGIGVEPARRSMRHPPPPTAPSRPRWPRPHRRGPGPHVPSSPRASASASSAYSVSF